MAYFNQSVDTTETSVVTRTFETYSTVSSSGATETLEVYANINKDAQPYSIALTVNNTLPGVDAYYLVNIAGPTTEEKLAIKFDTVLHAAATGTTVAAMIVKVINAFGTEWYASNTANVITLTSKLPGTAGDLTVTVDCVQKTDNAQIANKFTAGSPTAGTGTGNVDKVFSLAITYSATNRNGVNYPKMSCLFKSYDPTAVVEKELTFNFDSLRSLEGWLD